MENDSEYIAYEILDNNAMNDDSIEAMYSKAELWIDTAQAKMDYPKL